jgi:hypothetical protein
VRQSIYGLADPGEASRFADARLIMEMVDRPYAYIFRRRKVIGHEVLENSADPPPQGFGR